MFFVLCIIRAKIGRWTDWSTNLSPYKVEQHKRQSFVETVYVNVSSMMKT